MEEPPHNPPGFTLLTRRLLRTALGALRNRGELLALEWQEEKALMTELLVWTAALLFFGTMAMLLLTATIIFLFPENLRIYVLGGFTLLYAAGALVVWLTLKSMLKREPFPETLAQVKKDAEWLESLE